MAGLRCCLLLVVLVLLLGRSHQQLPNSNANPFVDTMIEEAVAEFEKPVIMNNETFLIKVDLLLFHPSMDVKVTGGRLEGLQSLERSSDAIVSYSEESGSPVFSIATSLSLTDLVMRSMAHGEATTFGLVVGLPVLTLDVKVEEVTVDTIIDVDIGDFTDIQLGVSKSEIADIGYIDVSIAGLHNQLDHFVSPLTSLVVNSVKRDLKELVQPLLKETLQQVLKEQAPTDLTAILAG